MPSTKKTLHFVSSALLTAISVGLLGYAMSTDWVVLEMDCDREVTGNFSGSAEITLQLFNGEMVRNMCPNFGSEDSFQVIPALMDTTNSAPGILHGLVVCFLACCLLFSAGSILISLYNSVSNPYQTYMGPGGVYACSGLCACTALVALVIFVVNVIATPMAESLVQSFSQGIPTELRNKKSEMRTGVYLVVPYIVLSLAAIGSIYKYEHAAYTHRREQQRPTEDAPKEIMMY
ncbi:clarin-3 [Stegastes partitus]|uniref:Clarin-3 n=1 Tax=Stegastes partitus TaxID=144197 RepID=A0A3B4Z5Q5_9TELE|nr:PREDICTED: clarin-3 [Stegastes partitus]